MTTAALLSSSLVALALVAAACGSEGAPGADESAAGASGEPATRLELTIWPAGEGEGEAISYTLTCDPPGGDHPSPAEACAALAELGVEAFAPVPADAICTQQYGGPQEAHVRGVVDGEPLDTRLAYNDGCHIARWNNVAAIVPLPRGELR